MFRCGALVIRCLFLNAIYHNFYLYFVVLHLIILNFYAWCALDGGRHRGGRGHDALIGADVKIRLGPFKGCKGRVVDIKGTSVRVELEAQMKVVTGKCFLNAENGPHFFSE